jgi:hypothetical protein
MAVKEIKKILIYGMPRTATTLLQLQLAQRFSLPMLGEPINPGSEQYQGETWARDQSQGVMKILTGESVPDLTEFIPQGNFSSVLITCRRNLIDCCISLYFTNVVGYHFESSPELKIDPVVIPREHVDHWIRYIARPYFQQLRQWQETGDNYQVLYYEDIVRGLTFFVEGNIVDTKGLAPTRFVASEFNYVRMCKNYDEVKNIIQTTDLT